MRPFLLLVTALLPLAAQSIDQPLSLFNADPIDAFRLVRGDIGSGRMERVSVSGQAFPPPWFPTVPGTFGCAH